MKCIRDRNGWEGSVCPSVASSSDVFRYDLENDSWFAVRPSGTEPKIKVYYSVKGENKADAEKVLKSRQDVINSIINA